MRAEWTPDIPGFRGMVRGDAVARAVYAEAAGIARAMPRAVAVPGNADDVVALVRWAHDTRTALVPRGSGTSMAGGAVGPELVVDLSRLRACHAVDMATNRIWVEPGVLRDEVDAAARAHGLMFPVDPSSGAFCTVGGMTATNAAGAHTLRYGPMRRWVTAIDCVFDDGTRATVRRGDAPPIHVPAVERLLAKHEALREAVDQSPVSHAGVRKNSSGYDLRDYVAHEDLIDLLVGSEGTLALFVGIELALTARPAETASVLAAFSSLEDAVDGATAARDAGASACELLDRTFLEFARVSNPLAATLPAETEAVLLIEVEAPDMATAKDAAVLLERRLMGERAARIEIAVGVEEQHRLWQLRHAASPTLARLDPSLKSMQFIEDGCVPPARLADYVRGVRQAFARQGIRGAIFGHAGDAHVHVNPLIDVRDPQWRTRVETLLAEIVMLTVQLEGTLAGEHGDGRLRTPFLSTAWTKAMCDGFNAVKDAFDPRRIFNPGVKVPLFAQAPLQDIKYDPALAALPAEAQHVLREVELTRCYARFRLEMLESSTSVGTACS